MNKVKRSETFILHSKLTFLFKYWRLFSFLLYCKKFLESLLSDSRLQSLWTWKQQSKTGGKKLHQCGRESVWARRGAHKLRNTTDQYFLRWNRKCMGQWYEWICETSTRFRVIYFRYLYLSYYVDVYSGKKIHLGKQRESVKNENSLCSLAFHLTKSQATKI